jgi:hypothetical protein
MFYDVQTRSSSRVNAGQWRTMRRFVQKAEAQKFLKERRKAAGPGPRYSYRLKPVGD